MTNGITHKITLGSDQTTFTFIKSYGGTVAIFAPSQLNDVVATISVAPDDSSASAAFAGFATPLQITLKTGPNSLTQAQVYQLFAWPKVSVSLGAAPGAACDVYVCVMK